MMQASNCLESPEQLDVGKLRVVDLRHCLRYLAENLGVPVGQIRSNTLKSTLVQTLKQKLGEVYQSSNRAAFEDTLAEINSLLAPRVSTFYAVTSYKWRDNVSYPMPVRPSPTIMSPSPGHTPTRRPVALSRSASGLRTGTESLGVSSARPDGEIGPPPGAYNKLLNQQRAASGTPGQQDYCYIAFKNLKFERSIYYDPITRVTPPRIGPDNRYGRSMVSLPFSLTSEQVEQLSKSKLAEASETKGIQKRLYLFMCSLDAANRSEVDPTSWAKLEYPLGLDIRVNGQMLDVQKHLKRIPHTPIDITSLVSLNFNSYNNVIVTYQYNKRIMALVQMVNKYSHKSIAQKLLINRLVPEEVVREKFEKALEDDELVATGDVISLKCPLSQCRINVPVRPKQCTHTQCFDAESFLSMSEVTRELQCPVCYQKIQTWNDIVVDGYFLKILESTTSTTDRVKISVEGDWSVDKLEADFVIDSDDGEDESDVEGTPKGAGAKRKRSPSSGEGRRNVSRIATPSLSQGSGSRGGGEGGSNVVDLTLDSDSDEGAPTLPRNGRPAAGSLLAQTRTDSNPVTTPSARDSQQQQQQDTPTRQGLVLPPRASHSAHSRSMGLSSTSSASSASAANITTTTAMATTTAFTAAALSELSDPVASYYRELIRLAPLSGIFQIDSPALFACVRSARGQSTANGTGGSQQANNSGSGGSPSTTPEPQRSRPPNSSPAPPVIYSNTPHCPTRTQGHASAPVFPGIPQLTPATISRRPPAPVAEDNPSNNLQTSDIECSPVLPSPESRPADMSQSTTNGPALPPLLPPPFVATTQPPSDPAPNPPKSPSPLLSGDPPMSPTDNHHRQSAAATAGPTVSTGSLSQH